MIELLDYLLDYDDNFWIVSNITNKIYGYIIYKTDNSGNRFNNITNKYYIKMPSAYMEIPDKIKRIFKPKTFYEQNKQNLTGV